MEEHSSDRGVPGAPRYCPSPSPDAGLSVGGGVGFSVAVVLPAGGTGERTGLHTPKQFCSLLNRPLISYTVRAFERVSWIGNIVVVVAKDNVAMMTDIIQRFRHRKARVVPGGSTRHRSIFNGVRALSEEENGSAPTKPDVVLIHDAVRPFVEEDFLFEIAMAAKENGAAGAIRPLVSTVVATTPEGYLDHSLERAKYRASEMPQGFRYDVIYQAYQKCSNSDFEFGTECLHLALQYSGINAKLIEGPPTLWKVTYKRDLAAAESIIKEALCRSAYVITGASARAMELALPLRKAMEDLDMELDVFPEVTGEANCLSKEWNFIQLSVHNSGLSEVEVTIRALEAVDRSLLHPVVVVLVLLSASDCPSISENSTGPAAIMELAAVAGLRNILLYGVQLRHNQDSGFCERSVERLARITATLIRDRNPVLAGQVLQA